MSLNGLDDSAVIESYQAALAEAGGWFLLKYVARDAVGLLSRGTGGVAEIRITIDGYQEASPLYGFLQYRRRKIILKYIPEGISRLLQARVSVQFQSFLDKFSPNDAVFHFSLVSELTEGALSSACLLHAASGSMTSSTSSLRRRKLGEITEDAEENATGKEDSAPSDAQNSRPRRESTFSRTSEATAVPTQRDGEGAPPERTASGLTSEVPDKTPSKPLPSVPRSRDGPRTNGVPRKQSVDQLEPRKSTQSARPSLRELDQTSTYRQKAKVGPRPSMDSDGRPRTAGSMGKSRGSSLVASLPAGVRSSARKSNAPQPQPQPQVEPQTPSRPPTKAPSIPSLLVPPPPINLDPTPRNGSTSPKSVMSVPASIGSVSKEKQRLMKALQLRKEQMAKRADEAEKRKSQVSNGHAPALPKLPEDGQASQNKSEGPETWQNDPGRAPDQSVPEQSKVTAETPQTVEQKEEPPATKDSDNDKKQVSPGLSAPDSAVDMVDTDSSVEESGGELTSDHPKPSINYTNGDMDSTTSTPIVDSTTSNIDQMDPKLDGQHSAHQHEPNAPGGPKKGHEKNFQDFNPSIPDTEPQGQIRLTEIETYGERSDPETPTPRAIPGDTIRVEMKPHDRKTPAAGEAEDVTAAVENHQPEPGVSSPQLPREPDVGAHAESHQPEPAVSSPQISLVSDVAAPVESNQPEPAVSSPQLPHESDVAAPVESHRPEPIISSSQLSREPDVAAPVEIPQPADDSDDAPTATVKNEAEGANTVSSGGAANLHHKASLKDRRRGALDPIRIPTQPESSDEENLLSDDSFMEELGSASVQEARPIALPKPGTNGNAGSPMTSRVVSSPTGGDPDVQALPAGRSASGSFSSMVPRKVNVSSGISKRIKALEMFSSSREPSPSPQPAPAPAPAPISRSSSQFDKFRKKTSLSQTSLPPTSDLKHKPSPEPENLQRPPLTRESSTDTTATRNRSSVSVTARIVRDQPSSSESPNCPSTQATINLQPSELTVEHDSQEEHPRTSTSTITRTDKLMLSATSSATQSPRNSMTGHVPRSESVPSRLSLSPASRYERTLSNSSGEQTIDEGKDDKRESRTSRMIRRMSSITSNSRRGLKPAINPSVKEEEPVTQPAPAPEQKVDGVPPDPPQVVDIGDVNVQFPDTLLWKRRFMRVDDQGYLILTPNTNEGAARNIVKRYPFSDLQTPCLPDHDRQELPNSIVLDFLDGSTLQCACESRQGQSAVLRTLIDAHRTYHNAHAR